jgi:hypothetical protein
MNDKTEITITRGPFTLTFTSKLLPYGKVWAHLAALEGMLHDSAIQYDNAVLERLDEELF